MATISTLIVNLTAKTASFQKGMKKGKKSLSSFGRKIKAVSDIAVKSFAVIGAAAIGAATALSFPIKKAMGDIDKIGKMSSELAISTEALVGLEHAAKITGASLSDVHKGLQIMTRRLGEAKQGYGEGKKGLEALGLSAEKVSKMGAEEAFTLIADKISKLESNTDKVAAAFSLFGRQGVNMLNTLNLGADGLAEMRAEADKLGLTFSKFEAGQVEAANDAITRLKALVQGVTNSLAIELAPYIEYAADHFTEMGLAGGDATQWITDKLTGLVKAIEWVVKGIALIKSAWYGVQGAFQKVIEFIIKRFEKLLGGLSKVTDFFGLEKMTQKIEGLKKSTVEWGEVYKDAASTNFDKAADNFSKLFEDSIAEQIENKLKENRENVKRNTSPKVVTSPSDFGADTKKSQDAGAMAFNSSLIDVRGMGNSIEDKKLAEAKKSAEANVQVVKNTGAILNALTNAIVMT